MLKIDNKADIYTYRVLFLFLCSLMVALIGRYYYLQVIEYDGHFSKSQINRVKAVTTYASRGFIFDRNGELLVDNYPVGCARSRHAACGEVLRNKRLHPKCCDSPSVHLLESLLGISWDACMFFPKHEVLWAFLPSLARPKARYTGIAGFRRTSAPEATLLLLL